MVTRILLARFRKRILSALERFRGPRLRSSRGPDSPQEEPLRYQIVRSDELALKPLTFLPTEKIADEVSLTVTIDVEEIWGLSEILTRLRSTRFNVRYQLLVGDEATKALAREVCKAVGVDLAVVRFVVFDVDGLSSELEIVTEKTGVEIIGFFRTSPVPVLTEKYLWELDQLLGPDKSDGYLPRLLAYLLANGTVISLLDLDNEDLMERFEKGQYRPHLDKIGPTDFRPMHWRVVGAELVADHSNQAVGNSPKDRTGQEVERYIFLIAQDAVPNWKTYEERKSFVVTPQNESTKVLAYFLPQFYETEENNRWWGDGFTEWTNVNAARPLYLGHEQRKLPHGSIGQYRLDDAATLRRQAAMMAGAGVSGLIFYHYWFSGKRILEKPSEILLSDPGIQIPFCFCWANENWTRRWDGNDAEILLGQEYSASDAREFIRVLIPFFRDSRHISVAGRPLIFVYRPSSIPDSKEYFRIWAEECRKEGIPAPYVVAVLTRGAGIPEVYGADAGAERVLFDWTGGKVRDVTGELKQFEPMTGSVLLYDDVANHYQSIAPSPREAPVFRSIIPGWDNSARYGSDGYLVHGSNPEKFQEWLGTLISDARHRSVSDERIVIVNAWNEWAEGAYLEPDLRNGFASLNSVGRALAEKPYGVASDHFSTEEEEIHINVEFSPLIASDEMRLSDMQEFLSRLRETAQSEGWVLNSDPGSRPEAKYVTLYVRKLGFLTSKSMRLLVKTALTRQESIVIPREFPSFEFESRPNPLGTISEDWLRNSSISVYFGTTNNRSRPKSVVLQNEASFFPASRTGLLGSECSTDVTAIVRVHSNAQLDFLEEALLSLAAQIDCDVQAQIMAQGFNGETLRDLEDLVENVRNSTSLRIEIKHHTPYGVLTDLRSQMLNQGLRESSTRFVTILDYDDVLLDGAYAWLLSRIEQTGKAVAVGRVFETGFDDNLNYITHNRPTFTNKGSSFEDFLSDNYIPIHSLMFDTSKISFSQTVFHPNQKYMEDYFLLLQILSPVNTDWAGLKPAKYVASYRFLASGRNTLGLGQTQSQALRDDSEYLFWETEVLRLRKKIRWKNLS